MDRLDIGLRELKFAAGDDVLPMTFSGYGAVFGNIDAHGDVIAPGAFAESLAAVAKGERSWPAMLSQHGGWQMTGEDMTPVGVWTEFAEDGKGLRVTGRLADTVRGRELYALMKMEPRPAIDGLSIGFIAKTWEPRVRPEDPKRTLKAIDLIEVSLVTRPANGRARVSAVKSIEELGTLNDMQEFLRDRYGCSKSEAVALIARIKRIGQGNPADDGPGNPAVEELVALAKRHVSMTQADAIAHWAQSHRSRL